MREYSEQEKIYFEMKENFEADWETYETINWKHSSPPSTLETELRKLGPKYDQYFKSEAGITMQDFIEKHNSFYSFTELTEFRLTGKKRSGHQPIKTKPEPQKPKKNDKLAVRLKTGLVSENSLGFSILMNEDVLDIDHKVWWIADVVAWAILIQNPKFSNEEKKKLISRGIKTLQNMKNHLERIKNDHGVETYNLNVPDVFLDSTQIRGKLNVLILNSDIHELVKDFAGVTIERKSKRLISGDYWKEGFEFGRICKVVGEKSGRFSSRNKQPHYVYCFIFDEIESLDFLLSVRLGFIGFRPPSYYLLKGGTQQIIRALCWTTKPTDIKLDDLCRIAAVGDKHTTNKRKRIEKYLTEAKEAGFIGDFAPPEEGGKKIPGQRKREYRYVIFKVKKMPVK